MKERREHLRILKENPISVRLVTKKGYSSLRGAYLLDLSAGGAKIFAFFPCQVKDLLEIDLSLQDVRPLKNILGEVAWVKQAEEGYKIGIKFIALSYEQEKTLRRYCYAEQMQRHRLKRASLAYSLPLIPSPFPQAGSE